MPAEIPEARILEAVRDVIFEHGYARATTKQIALAAGIGEATLFRRFGTKETLLLEALKVESAQFTREGVAYTGDVQADLERIVRTYNRLLKQQGLLMLELLVELPRRPELREIVQPPWDAMTSVTTILGHYQKEGKLRGNAPWEAALTLLGPIVLVTALKTLAPLLSASIEPKEHVKQFLEGWECKEEEEKV